MIFVHKKISFFFHCNDIHIYYESESMTLHYIVKVFCELKKKEENYLNILCILFYESRNKSRLTKKNQKQTQKHS